MGGAGLENQTPNPGLNPLSRGQVGSGSQDRCAACQGSNIVLPKTPHRDSDGRRTRCCPPREITHLAPGASLEYPRRAHEMSGSSPGRARWPCGTLIDFEFNLATHDPSQPRVVLIRLSTRDDIAVSRRARQQGGISAASAHPAPAPSLAGTAGARELPRDREIRPDEPDFARATLSRTGGPAQVRS
jgi:hypothetical protein